MQKPDSTRFVSVTITKEELEAPRNENRFVEFMKSQLQATIDRLNKKSERSSEPEKT